MAQNLDYKCPACGGTLEFDSETQKMKCPYCDSVFDVSELKTKDAVLDTQEADIGNQIPAEDSFEWGSGIDGEQWTDNDMSVFICKSCGGEIVADSNTAATSCPYCGNATVLSGRLSGVLKPDFVIPFKLNKEQAKAKLKEYTSKRKFAPKTFSSENRLEEIKGIYVPFWLFDSNINASVQYEATNIRTWRDGKYEYTETSFYDVFRQGTMSFNNIPVDGSTKMADELMESIEPFDFSQAVDFQTAYLAGYLADKYDVTMEQSIPRANERIKHSAEDTLRNTVNGYATVTPKFSSVQLLSGVSKYALYPVWILNTDYKGEKYTFAMNGQTGKFTGNLPIAKGKLWALFAGVAAGAGALCYAIISLLGII